MVKHILTLSDLNKIEFQTLFDRAIELKKRYKSGISDRSLEGRSLGLIFDKPSTRTRVSFETAIIQLGGTPIFMSSKDTQISRDEPVKDTARVLSRFIDALAIRTFSQDILAEYAESSTIPVINALTDLFHPCQVLSDLMTVIECKGEDLQGLKIVWVGDGNNVAHSWINAAAVLNLKLVLACPEDYSPDKEILAHAIKKGKGRISVITDPFDAASDADVIYTDVWASMGQEEEQKAREKVFKPFQINSKLLDIAAKGAIVMHCLPAHRGEEITDDILEGPNSVVWDQSENKMHMHKAILDLLINKKL